ncbi:unnamed protein product [Blepharisma stoltei]|uniref:WW domain-containing protein n=1 Tax=Blepharisma stoltei TaxID=1481888 RepID=A0AAU9K3X0_9CILI|nr:unnamed protein product [Blepharisma stoltei]
MNRVETVKIGEKVYPVNEVKALAEQLGMDYENEGPKYEDFLANALYALLPVGWRRERDPSGRILYHNDYTNVTTEIHPLLYQFRRAFQKISTDKLPSSSSPHRKESNFTIKRQEANCEETLWSSQVESNMIRALAEKNLIEQKNASTPNEIALKQANEFYDIMMGDCDVKPPEAIVDSIDYQLVNPKQMYERAKLLGIDDDTNLYWIARLSLMLPLPPLWKVTKDDIGNDLYMNIEGTTMTKTHPGSFFISKLIAKARVKSSSEKASSMVFHDKKSRKYIVNLNKLQNGEDIISYQAENSSPKFLAHMKYFQPRMSVQEVLDDIMILEIAQDSGINLDKELHLIGLVFDFMDNIKIQGLFHGWEFRYTMQGHKYWYHGKQRRSCKFFPYKDSLAKHIRAARKEAILRSRDKVLAILDRHKLFWLKGKDFFLKIRKDALNIINLLIARNVDQENPEVNYDLRSISQKLEKALTENEMLDLLFASPFIFDIAKIEEELPKLEIDSDISWVTNSETFSDISLEDINEAEDPAEAEEASNFRKEWIERSKKRKKELKALRASKVGKAPRSMQSPLISAPESIKSDYTELQPELRNIMDLEDEDDEELRRLTESLNRKVGKIDSQIISPASSVTSLKKDSPSKLLDLQVLLKPVLDQPEESIQEIIEADQSQSTEPHPTKSFTKKNTLKRKITRDISKDEISERIESLESVESEIDNKGSSHEENKFILKKHRSKTYKLKVSVPKKDKRRDNKSAHDPNSVGNDYSTSPGLQHMWNEEKDGIRKTIQYVVEMRRKSSLTQNGSNDSSPALRQLRTASIGDRESQISFYSSSENQKNPLEELIQYKKSKNEAANILNEQEGKSSSDRLSENLSIPTKSIASSIREEKTVKYENSSSKLDASKESEKSRIDIKDTSKLKVHRRNSAEMSESEISKNKFYEETNKTNESGLSNQHVVNESEVDTWNYKEIEEKIENYKQEVKRQRVPHISRNFVNPINLPRASRVKMEPTQEEETTRVSERRSSRKSPYRNKSSDYTKRKIIPLIGSYSHLRQDEALPKLTQTERTQTEQIKEKQPDLWFTEFLGYINHNAISLNIPQNLLTTKEIPQVSSSLSQTTLVTLPRNTLQSSMSVTSLTGDRNSRYFTLNSMLHEKSKSIISNLIKDRQFLDEGSSFKFKELDLPAVDLSKRTNDKNIIEEIKDSPSKMHFSYYLERIGNPFTNFISYELNSEIQPSNLVFMGKRLGLKVSMAQYESIESDLLWIVHLQLAYPAPDKTNKLPAVKLCALKFGEHPGDSYFLMLLQHQRAKRLEELAKMPPELRVESTYQLSWLPFKDLKGNEYFYNFLTHTFSYSNPYSIGFKYKVFLDYYKLLKAIEKARKKSVPTFGIDSLVVRSSSVAKLSTKRSRHRKNYIQSLSGFYV